MKRFTGHTEEWGTFLDVKHWPEIKNPKKYAGQRVVIGSVTDGYNPQEEQFGNTRKLLEQLIGSDADILICTKSDLVVRDIDLLKKLGRVTVSWSINTCLLYTSLLSAFPASATIIRQFPHTGNKKRIFIAENVGQRITFLAYFNV